MEGWTRPGSESDSLGVPFEQRTSSPARRDIAGPTDTLRAGSAVRLLADWQRPLCVCDERFRSRSIQFFLGGPGSGAQPHWHSLAWNWLVHGQKRWMFWPPQDAVYAQQHTALSLPLAINASGRPLRCVQKAGDVLVVPENWGHATINAQTSIGWATEVQYDRSFDLGLRSLSVAMGVGEGGAWP